MKTLRTSFAKATRKQSPAAPARSAASAASMRSAVFTASALAALCLLSLGACSDMSRTQQRTLSGAAIGAGVGTVGTVMTGGCVSCGAAIGAGVGAGAGYAIDKMEK